MFKKLPYFTLTALFLGGCSSSGIDNVAIVSQKFIHKYGFDLTPEEWQNRDEEGQVVSRLKNGVTVVSAYDNGILHGPTTYTYPNSPIVEKMLVYNQGTLVREVFNDPKGIPITENAYEFDDRQIVTLWDSKGAPLSIEEFDGELLVEGKFFTPEHELEGKVEAGFGERYRRDRSGLMICRELIENGVVVRRTNYHPNGQLHSISNYHDYQLHGDQKKFTSQGKPLMDLKWNHGILNGMKVVYRDGLKVSAIPYINGQKHGIEVHYDDFGNTTAEVEWKNDKKYGQSRFYHSGAEETEWFYNGALVSQEKFETLKDREQLVADQVPQ